MTILIVFPLQEELDLFLQGCAGQGLAAETSKLGRLPVTHLPRLGLMLARGGLGKAQFAVQTQHLIDCGAGWQAVICAGAAGALDDRLSAGDVVIGAETVEYDIRNKFGKPRLPRFPGDKALVEEIRGVRLIAPSFTVHVGAIASGDEDVVDAKRRQEVRDLTGALANAWEGAGGARAGQFSGLPFVEIRGISDGADETAAHDFEKNLPVTMGNIAKVIVAWAAQRSRP